MKSALIEKRDLHTEMACQFFSKKEVTKDERALVKGLNFGIIYGMGANGIMESFGKTKNEAWDILNRYRRTFPILKQFNDHVCKKVTEEGFIRNPFGRKRRLNQDEAYKGVNALVQGTCGDIMKHAMVRIHNLLAGTRSNILVTIHDELVIEIHKDELDLVDHIKHAMEDFPQFDIPLQADVKWTKTNWADKVEYEGKKGGK
jgi:DNA polymerase-1